jgi:hypothetical protein
MTTTTDLTRLRWEFTDYDTNTLPPIPSDWEDVSWHNDAAPSWRKGDCVVFVNLPDPDDREIDLPRFVINHADLYETLFMSDEWQDILDFVTTHGRLPK